MQRFGVRFWIWIKSRDGSGSITGMVKIKYGCKLTVFTELLGKLTARNFSSVQL